MSIQFNVPNTINQNTPLRNVPSGSFVEPDYSVKYVQQTLTEQQQAQARANIGAAAAGEAGGAKINEFHYTRTGEPGSYAGKISCPGYEPAEGDLMTIVFDQPFSTSYNPVVLDNGTTNPTVTMLNAETNATDYDEINPEVNTKWTVCLKKVNDAWVAVNISTQVQADWSTVDINAPSYIKNKPEIPSASNGDKYSMPFYIENLDITVISGKIQNIWGTVAQFEVSEDGKTWRDGGADGELTEVEFTIPAKGRLYFKAKEHPGLSAGTQFKITTGQRFNIGGNILSLRTPAFENATFDYDRFYGGLFSDQRGLVDASNLGMPRESVTGAAWGGSMFANCTSLVKAPELPATYVGQQAYESMFSGCTSLIQAPALPATSLGESCYHLMFENCTSLAQAPALPATTLATNCYHSMFMGCTSLTTAPAIHATEFRRFTCGAMFANCTSLVVGPAIGDGGNFVIGNNMQQIFDGCSSLQVIPELRISDLIGTEMYYMFAGCSSLHTIYCHATNIQNPNFGNCFIGLPSVGTFYCASGMKSTWEDLDVIPSGWTIVEM